MRVFDATSQPKCLDTEDFAATNFEILGGGNERQGGNGTSELDMLTFLSALAPILVHRKENPSRNGLRIVRRRYWFVVHCAECQGQFL